MTDRLKGCTVVFESSVREDDAEPILAAIRMMKGVRFVLPLVDTFEDQMARERVRLELGDELLAVLFPERKARS